MSPPEKPDAPDEPPATEAVLVSEIIPATRERIFAAWIDSDQHSAFTGDTAQIDPVVGGLHSSFAGYASGTIMSLEPFRRIVQTWRSTDFPQASADSLLEITLEETVGGTLVTLLHSEIPTGQSDRCRDGWLRFYLEPLKRYFVGRLSNGVHAADEKALAASRASAPRSKRAQKPMAAAPSKGPRRKVTGRAKVAAKAAGKSRPKVKARPKTGAKKAAAAKPAAKRAAAPRKRAKATQRTQIKPAKRAKPGKASKAGASRKSSRKPARKPRK